MIKKPVTAISSMRLIMSALPMLFTGDAKPCYPNRNYDFSKHRNGLLLWLILEWILL